MDDEPGILNLLARLLGRVGYLVDTTSNPLLALVKVRQVPYDLVIVDLAMPTMDGCELAVRIKAFDPWLPVLMLTGTLPLLSDEHDTPPGTDRLLMKPAPWAILRTTVQELVAGNQRGRRS